MTRPLSRAETALAEPGCWRALRALALAGDLPQAGDGGKIMTVQGSVESGFRLQHTAIVEITASRPLNKTGKRCSTMAFCVPRRIDMPIDELNFADSKMPLEINQDTARTVLQEVINALQGIGQGEIPKLSRERMNAIDCIKEARFWLGEEWFAGIAGVKRDAPAPTTEKS